MDNLPKPRELLHPPQKKKKKEAKALTIRLNLEHQEIPLKKRD